MSSTRTTKLGVALAAIALAIPFTACQHSDDTDVDLGAFKSMAASADCDDVRNDLYLIDDTSVFWDREGSCPDRMYTFTLFADTPSEVRCSQADSIAGPGGIVCNDASYRPMLETIIAHRDEPDLGLGSGHVVVPIPF